MPFPKQSSSSSSLRNLLFLSFVILPLILAPAAATAQVTYTPQVYSSAIDTGQDFTAVPQNTAWNASNGINQSIWNNVFWYGGTNNPGPQFYFAGSSGLWITSSASLGWPNTGMMQQDTTCSAAFGYGDFHWRSAEGQSAAGPGSNQIMWPADGDPGWPGIIAGSTDNHIGEVDISEVNYASNDTLFSTFHFYNANAPGNNGQIQQVPLTFPSGSGDMTAMHDFDAIWEPGSLVIKVDGVAQLSAPTAQVRADYVDGGCNYTLGAQMAMQATGYDKTPDNWIEIANMWWSPVDNTSDSAGALQMLTLPTYTPSTLALDITVNQLIAGGIRLLIDGQYVGVIHDVSGVGTHDELHIFPTAPSPGTHTATYYLTDEQSTTAVTVNFVVP